MLTDGRTDGRIDDGRTTDAGVTGILIAHLGAFGSGELKTQKKKQQQKNNISKKQQNNNGKMMAELWGKTIKNPIRTAGLLRFQTWAQDDVSRCNS